MYSSNGLDLFNQFQDARKVLLGVPGSIAPEITLWKVLRALNLSGKKPSTNRAVCDNRDTEFPTGLKDTRLGRFDIETERAILNLVG